MKENHVTNIIIAGVGGQGTLLASDVISIVAMESGYDVKKSEVHGMAQRGGSVISHVRFGRKVFSPLIQLGKADFIISFEKLEALRFIGFLKKDGTVIINDQKIFPMAVSSAEVEYPTDIEERIKMSTQNLIVVDAIGLARKLGNKNVVNVIMLGVLSNFLEFSHENWEKVLVQNIPKKFIDVNMEAFRTGRSQCAESEKEDR